MINIETLKQGILAAVGALILTTTAVGAAVGPAVETAPMATGAEQA